MDESSAPYNRGGTSLGDNVVPVGAGTDCADVAAGIAGARLKGASLGSAAVKASTVITLGQGGIDNGFVEGDAFELTVDGTTTAFTVGDNLSMVSVLDNAASVINAAALGVLAVASGEGATTLTVTCVSATTISAAITHNAGVSFGTVTPHAGIPAADPKRITLLCAPGVTRPTAAESLEAANNNIDIVFVEDMPGLHPPSQLIEVATELHLKYSSVDQVNAQAGHFTRKRVTISHDCINPVFEFGNITPMSNFSTGAMATSETFTVKAAAIEVEDTVYPIYFDGERSKTITGDGTAAGSQNIRSDPAVGVSLKAGDVVYLRSAVINPANGLSPAYYTSNFGSDMVITGQWSHAGADGQATLIDAPYVASAGNFWYDHQGTAGSSVGPSALFGTVDTVLEPVLIIGDSITAGYGANVTLQGAWLWQVLIERGYPVSVCARGGAAAASEYQFNPRIAQMAGNAKTIIIALGLNDYASAGDTLAQFKTHMIALWARFPGKRIIALTISPADGCTDGTWTANLLAKNAWLRSCPAPLAGVLDFADLTMTYRDSNVIRPLYYTADGTHPNAGYGQINDEIRANPAKWLPFFETGARNYRDVVLAPVLSGNMIVTVAANGVFVGANVEVPVPRGIGRGFIVECGVPVGGAALSGTLTINWAMGSDPVGATDQDVGTTTPNADDVMASVSATTAASSSATTLNAYVGKYNPAATHVHFNLIGKAATVAGSGVKTITVPVKIWAVNDPLA